MMDSNVLSMWVFYNDNNPQPVNMVAALNEDNVDIWKRQPTLYNGMGFNSLNEYIDSIPGKMGDGSAIVTALEDALQVKLSRLSSYGVVMPNISFSYLSPTDETISNAQLAVNQSLGNSGCNELFIVPTINEVKTCAFFNRAKDKDLWFCSDWEG